MQLIERRIILISNIFVLGSEKNQLFGHCKERYVLTKSSSVFLFLWISFQHTQVKRFPPRMVEWCHWQSWNSVLGMFTGNQKGIPLIILAAKFLILREGNRNSVFIQGIKFMYIIVTEFQLKSQICNANVNTEICYSETCSRYPRKIVFSPIIFNFIPTPIPGNVQGTAIGRQKASQKLRRLCTVHIFGSR